MNKQEQQFEIARLAETRQEIEAQIKMSEQTSSNHQHSLHSTLKEYWKSGAGSSIDEAQFIETMNRQRLLSSHLNQTSDRLRKMLNSPYFGRIDFTEAGYSKTEKIYIGIGNLGNSISGDFMVYDWRAPVSSMFYDYGRGQAAYRCPAGTISGTISLKRQYKIVNAHIEYMFDSDLKIDDEILQQLLGKSADDKMHTIVNSIQHEQNQVIRDQTHKILFVEGPAGCGKTSVALHRIAFLLYHERQKLTARNVLILSPNHIFSDYISNVLPEIGEENVVQMTFQDYVTQSITNHSLQTETRKNYFEKMLSAHPNKVRASAIKFKSSKEFREALIKYLNWLASDWINTHPAIIIRGKTFFRQDEWRHYYTDSFSKMPPALRLEKIRIIIQNRMRDFVHTIREEKAREISDRGEEINEKVIKALARIQARDELKPITDKIEKLTTLDAEVEYKNLFTDNRLFQKTGISLPVEWGLIKKRTCKSLNNRWLPYEDIGPFLYFQGVLHGFAINTAIKHVVIDEAQDYTAFQYQILAHMFPNSSWTIVGDPMQAVQPFLTSSSFVEAGQILNNLETPLFFRLHKSYRSTKEIQAFCQALLPDISTGQSINRPGSLPVVSHVNPLKLDAVLARAINSFFYQGWHSVAIITKNASEAETVYRKLIKSVSPNLVIEENDKFHHGVVVIPSYLAKGLEFDAVLVFNANAQNYYQKSDRHILYTICTRALHRLHLFYTDNPSPFLEQVCKNLYETVNTL
ncbi:HelD family protein [Sporomusa acidovorans]|uniref:DNA helicase IV n=1 Tax=Sporomusa acidovorans (strain ATCC 49682 / DSM 3132 / Mol) TaxID=1123286 RepID=A0ABZ3J317_SPOA4|nr:UvrD-helicase domain-containing protein [Sporomusa acidovorans]OZC20268.1 helicase IV [Sporomusa acidovorans DSM 3132]SDD39938.1 DNA helicase-2 / ATP-dependent DNA helicase PcrA [Sporomusa acidovorans]